MSYWYDDAATPILRDAWSDGLLRGDGLVWPLRKGSPRTSVIATPAVGCRRCPGEVTEYGHLQPQTLG